jgi:hypothetical protein
MTRSPVLQLRARSRWMAYALDAATANETVRREVDHQIAREPALADRRSLLTDLLTTRSTSARVDEAALGALRYEAHPVRGDSIASMTGWLIDRNPNRTAEDELADNLARFAVQTRLDHVPPRVRRVSLPYGNGVRVETARRPVPDPVGTSGSLDLFPAVEYHIPLDQPPASLLFVRFLASNLVHIDHLVDEFELIVRDVELPTAP